MEINVSASDLAKALKLTVRRVNQLAKQTVLRRQADGKFHLPDSVEAYYVFKLKSDDDLDYNREHALLEKAKRETAEIELEQLKGRLLYASDVEQAMATMILTAKSRLLSIPTKCASKAVGQKDLSAIVEIIRSEIYEALNELKETPAPKVDEGSATDI